MVLRCPNYPGWSAYCKDVKLAVDCEEQVSLGFGAGWVGSLGRCRTQEMDKNGYDGFGVNCLALLKFGV